MKKAAMIARLRTEIFKASVSADWNAVDAQGLGDLAASLADSADFPEISDFVQAVAQDIEHVEPTRAS